MSLRRLFVPALLGLALLATGAPARADDCQTPYTSAMVSQDLGAMNLALRSLDEDAFNKAGERMDTGLPCMTEALPVAAYASAYRFLGAWRYLTGDKDIGTRWFRTALEVDSAFSWDVNDLPQGHPLRDAFEGERAMAGQAAVPVDGMVLDAPPGKELWLDGRPVHDTKATSGRPHLLQVVDPITREVSQGWLIDGNDFPAQVLITQAEADARVAALAEVDGHKAKKDKKSKGEELATVTATDGVDPFAVQAVRRVRPAGKTPLLITGAVGIVVSGVIYGMSFPAHSRFEGSATTDELLANQTATNTLVIASGATLAVGMGIGIVGIQLDSTPGLVFGRRF